MKLEIEKISHYENGGDTWYIIKDGHPKQGHYHREDGPAYIGKNKVFLAWWILGLRHRAEGPALIDKRINKKEWWWHGKEVKDQHCLDCESLICPASKFDEKDYE